MICNDDILFLFVIDWDLVLDDFDISGDILGVLDGIKLVEGNFFHRLLKGSHLGRRQDLGGIISM